MVCPLTRQLCLGVAIAAGAAISIAEPRERGYPEAAGARHFLEGVGVTDIAFIEMPGATKAVIDGRLDSTGVDAVEIRFQTGIASAEAVVIVDLSKVSFIASLGIRMLLSAARSLRNTGRKLLVFGANTAVSEILRTTALADVIPVLQSEAEALAAAK